MFKKGLKLVLKGAKIYVIADVICLAIMGIGLYSEEYLRTYKSDTWVSSKDLIFGSSDRAFDRALENLKEMFS